MTFFPKYLIIWVISGHITLLLAVLNHDLWRDRFIKDYVAMLLMGPVGLFCQAGIILTDWLES